MRTATTSMTQRPDALAAVAAGYRAERDIIAQTGRSQSAVLAELQHQIEHGCLRRTWYGHYRITEHGRQVLLARFTRAPRTEADEFDPATATVPEMWQHRVAPVVLRGSTLTARPPRPGAEEYTLKLGPSGQLLADVLRAHKKIAVLLQRPVEQVVIEKDPGQDDGQALLQLISTDSPLYQVIEHPGPAAFDPATGQVTIGLYGDRTPARWRLWDASGAHSGAIAGGVATGTTVVQRGLLAAVAGSDLVNRYAIDLAGLNGLAVTGQPTAVTAEAAMTLLLELNELLQQRLAAQAENPRRWSATAETPLVLLAISRLDELLSHHSMGSRYHVANLINRLQQIGHKAGIAVVGEVKQLSLDSFFSDTLRAGLVNGNLVALRQTGGFRGEMTAMNPCDIPERWAGGRDTAGVGYTSVRSALFRAYYIPATVSPQWADEARR